MDKQQIITGIKKNIVSILCGVAALLALGFQFFWVSPRVSSTEPNANSIRQRVEARKAKADEISKLITRDYPNVTPTSSGPNTSLGMFPTVRNIEAGKAVMERVKAQANEVLTAALGVNRRVPLGYSSHEEADASWPLEGEDRLAERNRFKQLYISYVNADNSRFDPETGAYGQGTLQAMLGATRPPTQKEMQDMEGSLEMMLKNGVPLDQRGNPADPEDFQRRLAEGRIMLAARLKYRRAQLFTMYIDANVPDVGPATAGFSVHPIASAAQPTAVDCFNAQIGLWVQETVADNLLRANEEALSRLPTEHRNVLFAPVKHLVSVSVANAPFGDPRPVGPAAAGAEPDVPQTDVGAIRGGAGKAPAEAPQEPAEQTPTPEEPAAGVPMDPAAAIERAYALSPSGRPLNTPFYDLVPFRVMLRCDAQSVPYVVEQLQAESFLTVLNIEMIAVDPAVAAQQGYVYGDRPVMQLSLQCEIPFMRAWLVPLMPPGLQAALAARAQQ